MNDDALHTYLNFEGNAEEAFHFYKSVFGGEFSSLVRFRDLPMEGVSIPQENQDKIMHIAFADRKDDILMASDTLPSLGQEVQGNNVYISFHPGEQRGSGQDVQRLLREG